MSVHCIDPPQGSHRPPTSTRYLLPRCAIVMALCLGEVIFMISQSGNGTVSLRCPFRVAHPCRSAHGELHSNISRSFRLFVLILDHSSQQETSIPHLLLDMGP